MKNLLIALLIIATLAAAIAGGVYLFSQSADAQSPSSNDRGPGEGRQAPPAGAPMRGGPFRGALHDRGDHEASALGALPKLFGHLAMMVIVIVVTLSLQKLARRLPRYRSA